MSEIISYSENAGLARELVAIAGLLAQASGGSARAVELDSVRTEANSGPVTLVTSDSPLAGDHERAALALAEVLKSKNASVVLIGATRFGRMVAASLAVVCGMSVLSDVRDVRLDDAGLTGTRGVFAGKFSATVASPLPCIALISQGAYERSVAPGSAPELLTIAAPLPKTKRIETKQSQRSTLDLRSAEVIVAAGRGVKRKEDLAMIEQLASALGGVMGASRPLSSDLGWLGEEYHIGLTGIYVRPDLYVAVGISGQLQHVAGMKDSRVIAAINKDKQAPIFQVADYGVVGDLYLVVPALLKALGSQKS